MAREKKKNNNGTCNYYGTSCVPGKVSPPPPLGLGDAFPRFVFGEGLGFCSDTVRARDRGNVSLSKGDRQFLGLQGWVSRARFNFALCEGEMKLYRRLRF